MLDELGTPPAWAGNGDENAQPRDIPAAGESLSWLEQAVIALAHRDPLSSLKEPRRFFCLTPAWRSSPKLADPRLEALRRYVVQFSHRGAPAARIEREALVAAGYSPRRIAAIERLIAPRRSRPAAPIRSFPPAPAHPCGPTIERETVPTNFRFRPQYIACMGVVSLALVHGSAHAQDWSGAPQQADAQPASATGDASSRSEDHIIIGVGGGYAPAYEGADTYRGLPVPMIDIAQGRFFANLRNGIGLYAVDTGTVKVGVSATYMPGYRSKDVPDGIGKLDIGLGARAFASVNAYGVVATIGATKGVLGGNKGVVADLSLSYPVAVTSRLTLIPTIGTTWSDGRYNRSYFGVDAAQSFASGLSEFQPGSGFKDASAMLTASYRLTDHVLLGLSGGATTLVGDVKDSPLVYHRTQPSGFLSVAYSF